MKTIKQTLQSYKDSDLDESELLSKEIAMYLLDVVSASEPYRYHNYPVNQLFGIQNGYPSFMDAQHQVNSVEDAENYISRLHKVKVKFEQNLEGLKLREQKGIIPPRFVIDRVLEEMTEFVSKPVEENILYSSLQKKLTDAEGISPDDQTRLLSLAKEEIISSVHPAYQLFINYFERVADKATNDDGIWKLPDGDIVYAQALKFFTTTDYSADYIHDIGLKEVDRIQLEIMAILQNENYDVSQGFTSAIESLAAEEKFYYPDTKEGRDQILIDYQTILDEINVGLDSA